VTVNPRRPVTQRTTTSLGNVQPVRGTSSDKGTGKTAEQMSHEMDELRDQQQMTTTCTRCGDRFVGVAGDARVWFRAHLAEQHPEVKVPRRSRSSRGWQKTSDADRDRAMVEVEARKAMLA
jgi:hypothetical protein